MEENTPKREYKYKLDAGDFEILFLKKDDEFEQAKSHFTEKEIGGIQRMNGETRLTETEVVGPIRIKNIDKTIFNLLCIKSKIEVISFENQILDDTQSPIKLQFRDCNVTHISFSMVSIDDFQIINCSLIHLIVRSSRINLLSFEFSEIKFLKILQSSSVNTFNLEKCLLEKITINYTTFKGDIDVSNCHFNELNILNNRNQPNVFISNCSSNYLNFQGCSFSKIELSSSILGFIDINESEIKNLQTNFLIAASLIFNQSLIEIYDANKQNSSLTFSRTTINKALFNNHSLIPALNWGTGNEMEFYFNDQGEINTLYFTNSSLSAKTLLSFSNSSIHSIFIEDFSVIGNLYFRQIQIAYQPFIYPDFDLNNPTEEFEYQIDEKRKQKKKEQFEQFQNQYNQYFKTHLSFQTIHISNSSLARTEFTDFPIGEYFIEFNNSKIIDCFVSGGSIPTKNVHIIGAEANSIKEYEQKASFFNQFKKIFEAQGDIYHATQFQAKWAEEQRKELALRKREEYKNTPKLWGKVKITFNSTSNDIVTLWLNMLSNLHGESWARTIGVFFLLIIPAIYFLLLVLMDMPINDKEMIYKYFVFLNPAHSMKFIGENKEITGAAIPIDFIGRIVVAYGIYQFIAAFRKHTKK